MIMQTARMFKTAWLVATLSITGWATAQAQTNSLQRHMDRPDQRRRLEYGIQLELWGDSGF